MTSINPSYKQIITKLNQARKKLREEAKSLSSQPTNKKIIEVTKSTNPFTFNNIQSKKIKLEQRITTLENYYKNHKLRHFIDKIRYIFRSSPLSKARRELNRIVLIDDQSPSTTPSSNSRVSVHSQNDQQQASAPQADQSPSVAAPATANTPANPANLLPQEAEELMNFFTDEEREDAQKYIEEALKEHIEESQLSSNLQTLKEKLGTNRLILSNDSTANEDFFRDIFMGAQGTIEHYLRAQDNGRFLISHAFSEAIREPSVHDIDSSDELTDDQAEQIEDESSILDERHEVIEQDTEAASTAEDENPPMAAFKSVDHFLRKLAFIKDPSLQKEIAEELSQLPIASQKFDCFHINTDRLQEYLQSNVTREVNGVQFKACMFLDAEEFEAQLDAITHAPSIADRFKNWWQGR